MDGKMLSVRLNGQPVGVLEQTISGKMRFSYHTDAAQALSINMPIEKKNYDELTCEAFFGGLLPESDNAKKAIGKRYGISYSNSFALLKAIGYDCAGAISFHAIDSPIITPSEIKLEGRYIKESELYRLLKALPTTPLFLSIKDLRLSLAGVQDKAAVCIIDNKIALPTSGCPTTHILKPAIANFPGIVENEFLCLHLASLLSLPVPRIEFRQINDLSYLLIERYDRRVQDDHVIRIHQEDFCQALGVVSAKKYQNEGGPSLKHCFELLNETHQPAIDRNNLAAMMVFNYLIGNRDAHGKNFSLLHINKSQIRLAPFYDLVCTQYFPSLTTKMAMKIGSKYSAEQILPRHWEQLCKEIGFSYPALKKIIKQQGNSILDLLNDNKDFYVSTTKNSEIILKIMDIIKVNIFNTLRLMEK